jgi:hypothetical protein
MDTRGSAACCDVMGLLVAKQLSYLVLLGNAVVELSAVWFMPMGLHQPGAGGWHLPSSLSPGAAC